MEDVLKVASYIAKRYYEDFCEKIDEMKLHKLMYFAQRESIIQTGSPLFHGTFYGWKYGPVLKDIRKMYHDNSYIDVSPHDFGKYFIPIMDKVFDEYAGKDSWSLSRLTHGELSWKNSRAGVPDSINSDAPISLDDIKVDAERVRSRRDMLYRIGII